MDEKIILIMIEIIQIKWGYLLREVQNFIDPEDFAMLWQRIIGGGAVSIQQESNKCVDRSVLKFSDVANL